MRTIPKIVKKDNGYSFIVNDAPYMMLAGEVHNSACTSQDYMDHVWQKAKQLHCNTVLAPVYWELYEPGENQFDFSLVEQLILGARQHQMKLGLLWFGSWKNGLSTYAPNWVKTDPKRFPRTENEHGVKTRTLSMFQSEILSVERLAFTQLMNDIQAYDAEEQTVIIVQVENEVGILGATRDFSPSANASFNELVPQQLLRAIGQLDQGQDQDEVAQDGSWSSVFSQDADEAFMSWHYALHINELARAGKAIYPLPMFTNAWLKEFDDEKPGFYPCGGPLPDMLEIWKCAAPHLDLLAPDIYTFNFDKIAQLYTRRDNPLMIPETRRDKWAVPNLYTAVGTYHTLGYAPFGLESVGEDKSFITQVIHTNAADKNVSSELVLTYLSHSYQMLGNMMPIITTYYGTDKMVGFAQNNGYMTQHIRRGKYQITLEFYHPIGDDHAYIPAAGIIIEPSEDELIFIGYGYRAYVETTNPNKQLDYLSLEKGTYDEQANWLQSMYMNGDEQYIRMEEQPTVLKAKYYEF